MKKIILLLSAFILGLSSLASFADPSGTKQKTNSTVDFQTVQREGGKTLRYRKLDTGYLLVLVPGQEIIQSLTAFQKVMNIKFATVTGLGDVAKVQLGHYNTKARKMELSQVFEDSNELTSLTCSLSIAVDAKGANPAPTPHCHVNIGLSSGDGNRVVGGHLISATVSVVGELFIVTQSQEILKIHDGPYDGNLFDLNALTQVSVGP